MRFLLDAHIPRRLCHQLRLAGHDCQHAELLPDGNRSSDIDIGRIADATEAVVVTKDSDFRITHQLGRPPRRLLLIAIGNCTNGELSDFVGRVLDRIEAALSEPGMVEIRREAMIITPLPD